MWVTFAPLPAPRQLTSVGLVKAVDGLRLAKTLLDAAQGTR